MTILCTACLTTSPRIRHQRPNLLLIPSLGQLIPFLDAHHALNNLEEKKKKSITPLYKRSIDHTTIITDLSPLSNVVYARFNCIAITV